ncbi:MAG: electron transfer flavoprotein subunit alpha/FixB family protein [Nitrososphaerota archaeon]
MRPVLMVAGDLDELLELRAFIDLVGASDAKALIPENLLNDGRLSTLGLSRVYSIEALDEAPAEALSTTVAELVRRDGPGIVVAPSKKIFREVFARAAQNLSAPCVTDCVGISLVDDRLVVDRPFLGGGYIERLAVRRLPVLLTVQMQGRRPSARKEEGFEAVRLGRLSVEEGTLRRVSVERSARGGSELGKARVVVSVGRGFKRREDLKLAEELAQLLEAELACSRPIASDLGWMPEEKHVGLSGKWISPQLYIALGISGQVQHMVGVRNSRVIVAVNNDASAPIHKEADYSIPLDLYKFVPALIQVLRERRSRAG